MKLSTPTLAKDALRGKAEKHEKVEVKRKWLAFSQPPYTPQGIGRKSPGQKLKADRLPYAEENPGSWYLQRLGEQAGPQRKRRRNREVSVTPA